jgi:imidazolonepropionase-like amidohydrolase
MRKKVIAVAALLTGSAAAAQSYAVQAGRLIVDAAQPPRGASTVIVENGRIVSIESGFVAPPGATVVDQRSRTVMPGLIDAHVHLTGDPGTPFWRRAIDPPELAAVVGVKNALLTARAGFTTVRDLGAAGQSSLALRDAIRDGIVPGPRIIASGGSLSIVGGHGDVSGFRPEVNAALDPGGTCTGADECAQRVREAAKRGADVIKITSTGGVLSQQGRGLEGHFHPEEIRAITSTAHRLGLKVAAHAHGARGIEDAARAGVDSIDHGTFADSAALQQMKANGTWYVPTLMAFTRRPRSDREERLHARGRSQGARGAGRVGQGPVSCAPGGRQDRFRNRLRSVRARPQRRGGRADGSAWRNERSRGCRLGDHGRRGAAGNWE